LAFRLSHLIASVIDARDYHYRCALLTLSDLRCAGWDWRWRMSASVEAMLDRWSAALREGKDRMRLLFKRPSVAASAAAYIDGLFGPERRKTGWMRAEAAGVLGPSRSDPPGDGVAGPNQIGPSRVERERRCGLHLHQEPSADPTRQG
jgi:hypothetical protein